MSGFVGLVGRADIDPALLGSLTAVIAPRGSEPATSWSSGPVGFGYAHLTTGRTGESREQPASLDQRAFIVGHILLCARGELIDRLAHAGVTVSAQTSDARLVLLAYREWGSRCLDHIIGEFAFAIWDAQTQTLLCVRDHFGVRPFYYAVVNESLVFSNSLTAILKHPGVSREINEVMVGDFLLCGLNLEQDTTGFTQVRRLPARSALEWRSGEIRIRSYYEVPLDGRIRYRRDADYIENLVELIDRATADRVTDGQPVAFRFSGGMDSTSVAATVRKVAPNTRVKGFTLHSARVMPADREPEFARAAAAHLGIELDVINCDDMPLFGCVPPVHPDLHEIGFLDANIDLFRRMAEHAPVALCGDTGDHVFLPPYGYFRDRLREGRLIDFATNAVHYVRRFRSPPPLGVSTTLRRLRHGEPVWQPPRWINRDFAERLKLAGRWERALSVAVPHPLRPYAHRIITGPLQPAMFEHDYAMAAVHKLESRHVFADVRLVEYLLAIPGTPWMFHKLILREAMRSRLPEIIRTRRKTPLPEFSVAALMRDRGADFSVVSRTSGIERFIDIDAHPTLIPAGMSHDDYLSMQETAGVSLAHWLETRDMDF